MKNTTLEIENIKKKILDLAIRGKLVQQAPNDEPASVLIEKIKKEKEKLVKEGKIKPSKNDSIIYKGSDNCYYEKIGNNIKNITKEIPFEIPESWCWVRLGNICEINLGFTYKPKYVSNGVPFLSVKDISSGKLDFSKCKYISNEEYKKASYGSKPLKGDIIFGRVGTMGKPQIVNVDFPFCIFVSLGFLRFFNIDINKKYITYWMNTELFYSYIKSKVKGTAQINLNTGWLKDFLLPLPPAAEEKRIFTKVEDILRKIDNIFNEINNIDIAKITLKNKILNLIFSDNSSYKSYYENEFALGDILPYEQPALYIVASTEYSDTYKTPVLTPGKTFVLGYTNEKKGIYKIGDKKKVIIFDDFTTASRLVDFDFKVKSSAMKILSSVDNSKFDIEYMYYLLQTIKINANTHKRFWISEYAPIKLKIHTYNEQLKIVEFINKSNKLLN